MDEIKNLYLCLGNIISIMDDVSIKDLKGLKNATETTRVLLMDLIIRKQEKEK